MRRQEILGDTSLGNGPEPHLSPGLGIENSSLCNLCVICVSVVIGMCDTTTTETQRTQRLHREIYQEVVWSGFMSVTGKLAAKAIAVIIVIAMLIPGGCLPGSVVLIT